MHRLLVSLVFLLAGIAHAADPFTVAGVAVDASGENAIKAQTEAISQGQLRAANMLIERVTLESDRTAKGFTGLEVEQAVRLIRAMEIANEKRSAGRYLGDITVAFNPPAVQKYVADKGLTMVATQSRERLVVPVITGKIAGQGHPWGAAWANSAFSHSLTPVRAAAKGIRLPISGSAAASGDLAAVRSAGESQNVRQVLVANARENAGEITVTLTDYALDSGEKRDLGRVQGYSFDEAASKALALLESDWKDAAINQRQNAETMSVSVLYRSHADWQRLQSAINSSSQISDARLDALSKDGALMTITYGGDISRLSNELSFKGVRFEESKTLGPVLSLSSRR